MEEFRKWERNGGVDTQELQSGGGAGTPPPATYALGNIRRPS